jgi:hypothetical protein
MRNFITIMLLVAALVTTAGAEQQFVSWNGGFYIMYPDEWAQVDYWLFDSYLLESDTLDSSMFAYEAVFAQRDVPHFFSGEYLILSIDTVGQLKDWQIDSVLIDLVESVGEVARYNPISEFLAHPQLGVPSYDTANQTVAILTDIPGTTVKKNLTVMKFYNKGIATFYFYAPDSVFDASKQRFEQILTSFSTDIESALPKESLKVADLKETDGQKGDAGKGGESKKTYLFYAVAILLILVVVIRFTKRKRSS